MPTSVVVCLLVMVKVRAVEAVMVAAGGVPRSTI